MFEINGALCARRAHFRGQAHVFRTCAPDVRTFFQSTIIVIYQRSAQVKSRAHIFNLSAPEGRIKYTINFEHCRWIQRFSSLSLNSWLARELGGGWRKLRIEISMPLKLPGFCVGHVLKCLATVVSLLCLISK